MISRRAFLAGTGGLAALGLGRLVKLAHSEVPRAPTRLLVIHKPIGTVPANYDCTGTGADFALSPILEPFAELRPHLVVVDGLDVMKMPNTPGEDHGNGMVTFMTGGVTYRDASSGVPLAERASIDQLLASDPKLRGDTPIGSLQLTADPRSYALFTRTLSYAGRGIVVPAEHEPIAAYARVFGSLADPAATPQDLARLRARKQSVLDFATADLQRVSSRLAGPERQRLDRHLESIREIERLVDRTSGFDTSALQARIAAVDPTQRDRQHAELGHAHLELVRAAFQCDLTRVVTFGWASGQSFVNFSHLIPGVQSIDFHMLSHAGINREADETAVHRWYNEQMATVFRAMRDTVDIDGRSLLDNTLIVVWSEMRLGSHTFDSVPIQLFGGAGGKLAGGRRVQYPNRPTNDLWLAIAHALGNTMPTFGDAERCTGPLSGLFS